MMPAPGRAHPVGAPLGRSRPAIRAAAALEWRAVSRYHPKNAGQFSEITTWSDNRVATVYGTSSGGSGSHASLICVDAHHATKGGPCDATLRRSPIVETQRRQRRIGPSFSGQETFYGSAR